MPTITETLLKRTTSRCPVCHASIPAEVWKVNDGKQARVFLRRVCAVHGSAEACISSDARFYWLAQGSPENQCSGSGGCSTGSDVPLPSTINHQPSTLLCSSAEGERPGTLGRNAAPGEASGVQERLATCLALIEIVNSCNLACPTCYADSPQDRRVDAVPLADLQRRIEGVIARKGRIEILQLSGGEPTLHPQFFELLAWLQAHEQIDFILLNTNGVRMANDAAFSAELGRTFRVGKFQLYLQFDGTQEAGQHWLRGADLRTTRERALARCAEYGITVTLAMTVTPDNLPHLWDAVHFGLGHGNVRGVSFQPMFGSGRTPGDTARLNTADVILALVEQSREKLRYDDFTPLPCGDPNCATIGYLLKVGGEVRSISDFVDFTQVQGFLRDKVRYSLDDLSQCGCENEPLAELLHRFELDATHTFRLFVKPFMDAWTWDEDRIDRCCTHVIRPDGVLDSFCRYYSGAKG